jgi:hypothetical protein
MSLDSVHKGPDQERPHAAQSDTNTKWGRASESVNQELIFRQISPLDDPGTQSITSASHEKAVHADAKFEYVASNEMLWERVLSLLVVGAGVLGGSTVLLVQALPPLLHGFP